MVGLPFPAALAAAKALHSSGAFTAAAASYAQLARQQPNHVELLHLRGALALQLNQTAEALQFLRRAVAAAPANFHYLSNYALALRDDGQLETALEHFEAALNLKSDSAQVRTNLGVLFRELGDFKRAQVELAKAAELAPDDPLCQGNYLLGLLYDDTVSVTTVRAAHRQWGEKQCAALPSLPPRPLLDRAPDRRLRLGFVSSDLREHAVALFLSPLIEALDRSEFELFAYTTNDRADTRTAALRSRFDQWRSWEGVSDVDAAEAIAHDRIDILVDLNGHTAETRIGIFAHAPAPVLLSYLGYPQHPGLPTVAYRISDEWADPKLSEAKNEPVWRLDRCAWCFQPPEDIPERAVRRKTSPDSEPVVFGSFNQSGKMSDRTISLWSQVLQAIPNSRLVLKSRALRSPLAVYDLMGRFLAHKVDISRISVLPWATRWAEHMQCYNEMDIALDTFPYGGTTTTCEALWMGLPVVTLVGETPASRVGASLLHACALDECIAKSDAEFVDLASQLAGDQVKLRALHAGLRSRMRASALLDKVGFARSFGAALREIWRERCRQAGDAPATS